MSTGRSVAITTTVTYQDGSRVERTIDLRIQAMNGLAAGERERDSVGIGV